MSRDTADSLISHLEDLRRALLKCLLLTVLLYPAGYYLTTQVIDGLAQWCIPEQFGKLYYFSPTEVFWLQLKFGLVLTLVITYPWNVYQFWRFLVPGLYRRERRMLGCWILGSSALFLGGIAFCVWQIMPMLMSFSGSFATPDLKPMIGIGSFLELTAWLSFAFGLMFQAPIMVLLAVNFGFVSTATLRRKRPYVATLILILAAILTPPDVVSQITMALPTWLLFEIGLIAASFLERRKMRMENYQDARGEDPA
jgi:sec-independent protein translocase protein TatC